MSTSPALILGSNGLPRQSTSSDTVNIPGNGTVVGTWNVNYSGSSPGSTGAVEIGDPTGSTSARVTITAGGQPTSFIALDCFNEQFRIFGQYRAGAANVFATCTLNGGAWAFNYSVTVATSNSTAAVIAKTTGAIASLVVQDTSGQAGIQINSGNGTTSPSKFIRTNGNNGHGEFVNSAYSAVITTWDDSGNWNFFGSITSSSLSAQSGANLILTSPGSSGAVLIQNASYQVQLVSGAFRPSSDNAISMGQSSLRWSVVYAASGTINTSDATEKTALRSLTDAELSAGKELLDNFGIYQWLDAIARKGADVARLHMGTIAQQVQATFSKYGLDAHRYGLFCYDQWDAEQADGDKPAVEAGERYGVRYEELHAFVLACLHQRLLKIEKTLGTAT